MRGRQNPFAETGAASSVTRLLDKYDSSIEGIEDQRTLTPFQRQVIDAAEAWEAEKQEEQRQQQQSPNRNQRQRNSRASPGSAFQNSGDDPDTVRFINKNEYPDHPVHDN